MKNFKSILHKATRHNRLMESMEESAFYGMDAYEKLQEIRQNKLMLDSTIIDELEQYMSSDELEEFVNHLIKLYDLDIEY